MSAGLTFAVLVPFALVVLLLLVIVVLVDRRDELDPEGRRPFAAYVFVVVFLTLFTVLFALASMVGSLVHLAVGDEGGRESRSGQSTGTFSVQGPTGTITTDSSGEVGPQTTLSSSDRDDAHIRDAVRTALLAVAAGGVLAFHLGMARRAADDPDVGGSRARRIYHSYLYAAMALAVIIVVGAATAFGYGVFKVLAPGVASPSGVGERKQALPDLALSLVLLAGAAFIFLYHFRRRPTDSTGPVAALPPGPDPFAPPPEPEKPAPPTRRPTRKAPAVKKATTRQGSRTE